MMSLLFCIELRLVLRRLGVWPSLSSTEVRHFGRVAPVRAASPDFELTQRFEARADVFRKELRLLPRCEVAAFGGPVVINQFGIGFLCPALRGLEDLVWKGADGDRNGDAPHVEKAALIFPIETSRRDCRVCQPVERDVVEDVVSREAFGFPVEYACDELIAGYVMIKYPRRETDGRIRDSVYRLRAIRHLEGVA